MDQATSQVQATATSGHDGAGQPSTATASLGTAPVQPAPGSYPADPSNLTIPGNVDGYMASSMPQSGSLGAYLPRASQPQMLQPQVQPLSSNLGQGPGQMQYQRPAFQGLMPAQPPGYVRAPQQQQYRAPLPQPTSAYAAKQQAMYNKVQHQVAGAAQATTGLPAQLGQGIPAGAVPQFRPGYSQPGVSVPGIPAPPGMMPSGAIGRPRLPGSMPQQRGSMAPGMQQGWRDPAFPTSAPYMQPGRPPVTTAAALGVRPTASTPRPGQTAPAPPSTTRKPGQRGPAKTAAQAAASGKKHCNCKNSRCLKLYCECFASGRYCDDCNCVSCCNNKENERYRQAAVETILDRNPNAFRPKIQEREGSAAAVMPARHNKGCNCKKSGCLKKYCECFQASIYCSENCKCVDCKNFNAAVGPRGANNVPGGASNVPTQKRTKMSKVGLAPVPPRGAKQEQPGSFTAALNDAIADRAGDGAQVPTPGALTETMREIVRHNGIEEMASLLLLVAEEEVDSRRSGARSVETGDSEGSRHSSAAADATGDVHMSEADQEPLGTERQPATVAPNAAVAGTNGEAGISALYKAQEHAVLQEFQSFLAKLVERVSKKAAEQEAAATSQLAAAPPKQQPAPATSSQQQQSDRVQQQSQQESPALIQPQGAMQQSTATPLLPPQTAEQTAPVTSAIGLQASQQLPPPISMPGSGPADLAQQPLQPGTTALASAAAQP